jgi:hypothetical protein
MNSIGETRYVNGQSVKVARTKEPFHWNWTGKIIVLSSPDRRRKALTDQRDIEDFLTEIRSKDADQVERIVVRRF